jgi:hypothetical protein
MSEGKGVALAILGTVSMIAVVGLVMLFHGSTAQVVVGNEFSSSYGAPAPHIYGRAPGLQNVGSFYNPYAGSWVNGAPTTWEGQNVAVIGGSQAMYKVPSPQLACPPNTLRMGVANMRSLSDDQLNLCVLATQFDDGSMCCPTNSFNPTGQSWQ